MYGHPDLPYLLAVNPRTSDKAGIKRASAEARSKVVALADRAATELRGHYTAAARSLADEILAAGDSAGNVRIEALNAILSGVRREIRRAGDARDATLAAAIDDAADLGVAPLAVAITANPAALAQEAVRFVYEFTAADGLKLSDRLWRIDSGATRAMEDAIQMAVIRGDGAARATEDFLSRGVPVPADVRETLGEAAAARLSRVPGAELLREHGGAYANTLRVFRTEINRAHGEAYQASALRHPETIGTRFLLSPAHPRADICDMHASVNLYGLGPGVYPPGANPWPAHPNTLSFVEIVFKDEVTQDDRAQRESREDWIARQPKTQREGVLGGPKKRAAFDAGHLKQKDISAPWRVVQQRLLRRGVDVDRLQE